jgi:hypothetical protein
VRASELEFGRGVVKPGDVLPLCRCVAALALVAQLPSMLVLVASETGLPQPEVRAAQVLHENCFSRGGRNAIGCVAAAALEAGVTAFQRIAGLAVVELIQADVPADRHELGAVMLRVAPGTLVVPPGDACHWAHQRRVKSRVRRQPLLDFHVTASAFELALAAAADMATGAVRRAVEFGVSIGKWTGRKLGISNARKKTQAEYEPGQPDELLETLCGLAHSSDCLHESNPSSS